MTRASVLSVPFHIGRRRRRHQPTGPVRQGRAPQVLQAQQLPVLRAPGAGRAVPTPRGLRTVAADFALSVWCRVELSSIRTSTACVWYGFLIPSTWLVVYPFRISGGYLRVSPSFAHPTIVVLSSHTSSTLFLSQVPHLWRGVHVCRWRRVASRQFDFVG